MSAKAWRGEEREHALHQVEVTLDKLWDTPRPAAGQAQRRAGPDQAHERSSDTVEGYLQ